MIDHSRAATARLQISLPAQPAPPPALHRRFRLGTLLRALARAAFGRVGPTGLDRDSAALVILERFDDPAIRRVAKPHPTPTALRDGFLLRRYGGVPLRW
jgi:hypothetical protein